MDRTAPYRSSPPVYAKAENRATPSFIRSSARHREQRVVTHVDTSSDIDHSKIEAESNMAQRIVERLQFLYPGHAWECTVDSRTGGVQLRIAVLMTGPHCYFFGFDDIATENGFNRWVQEAGGNLLERFKIPRSTFDLPAYMDAEKRAVFHINQKVPE